MAIACVFPGCRAGLPEDQMFVLGLEEIRAKIKRGVREDDLAGHALCPRHASMARREGLKAYSFFGTVKVLRDRAAKREEGQKFFSMFRAIEKAGIKPAAQRA